MYTQIIKEVAIHAGCHPQRRDHLQPRQRRWQLDGRQPGEQYTGIYPSSPEQARI